MERGTLCPATRRRSVFWTSTAARIRAYYEELPEASQTVPLVDPATGGRPSRFASSCLRGALRFSLTAGGSCLSEGDNMRFAEVLMDMERGCIAGTGTVGALLSAFGTPHGFLTATREEQARVLARLRWMEGPIVIEDAEFIYYYRHILTSGLDALASAEAVDFCERRLGGDGSSASASAAEAQSFQEERDLQELDDEDESRERRRTLDSELYKQEHINVRAVHGPSALVLGVQLHADKALVSWSGDHNIFPVRALFVNVVGRGRG